MKIFITGGSGFVGKNLIGHFGSRHEIVAPTHSELDLLDEHAVAAFLDGHAVDTVIHCANIGATRKTDALPIIVDHNVRMFLNLARQEGKYKRMVFFGSGAEFDKRQDIVQISDEAETSTLPHTQYGLSKYLCSHFIRHYPKVVNLRLFGVYGKYDDYENRFISNAVCRAVLGLPIVIYKDQRMDFVPVDDLVQVTEHIINTDPRHQFYNVSSGKGRLLSDIAAVVREVSGSKVDIQILHEGQAPEYTCNTARLAAEMPGFVFADFQESIRELYAWYEANHGVIDPAKFPV